MSVQRTLYHFPLDPASRQVRLALGEKRLAFEDVVVRYWEQPDDLSALNPSGLTPVLVEDGPEGRLVLCESRAILDYLEERHPEPALLGREAVDREHRREAGAKGLDLGSHPFGQEHIEDSLHIVAEVVERHVGVCAVVTELNLRLPRQGEVEAEVRHVGSIKGESLERRLHLIGLAAGAEDAGALQGETLEAAEGRAELWVDVGHVLEAELLAEELAEEGRRKR